jgi:membrane-associated phospholipid phosphatase
MSTRNRTIRSTAPLGRSAAGMGRVGGVLAVAAKPSPASPGAEVSTPGQGADAGPAQGRGRALVDLLDAGQAPLLGLGFLQVDIQDVAGRRIPMNSSGAGMPGSAMSQAESTPRPPPAMSKGPSVGERLQTLGQAEDALVPKVIGEGSKKGSTFFGRMGDVVQRPPMWAVIGTGLSATGERGRRAAIRGSACYLSAAAAHLPIKALVGRRHPPGSARHQLGPFTSSFPSGHAASDLAFVFGAAQEMPRAFVPLSAFSLAVHWSLIRKRAHYPSDVLVGGALGIGVALGMWKLWPPGHAAEEETPSVPGGGGDERSSGHCEVPDNGDPDGPPRVSDLGVTR